MGKLYFGTLDGKELKPLETINEAELSVDSDDGIYHFLKNESFEAKITLEHSGGLDPYRVLASGGDRSTYNALTLREEGKLTPRNGWLENE